MFFLPDVSSTDGAHFGYRKTTAAWATLVLIIVLCAVGVLWRLRLSPGGSRIRFLAGLCQSCFPPAGVRTGTFARIVKEGLVPHLPFSACATLSCSWPTSVAGWVPTYAMYSAVTLVPLRSSLSLYSKLDVRERLHGCFAVKRSRPSEHGRSLYLYIRRSLSQTWAMTNRYDLSVSPWMVAFGCDLGRP